MYSDYKIWDMQIIVIQFVQATGLLGPLSTDTCHTEKGNPEVEWRHQRSFLMPDLVMALDELEPLLPNVLAFSATWPFGRFFKVTEG